MDLAATQRRVVVDGHHRNQAELRALAHLAERGRARAPGTDDGDAHAALAVTEAAEGEQPRLEADQAEQAGGDDRPRDQHRVRDVLGAPPEQQEQDCARGGTGAQQAARFVDARVAPRTSVPAPDRGREDVHRAGRGEVPLERVEVALGHREVEPQRVEQGVGDERDDEVEHHERPVAPDLACRTCDPRAESPVGRRRAPDGSVLQGVLHRSLPNRRAIRTRTRLVDGSRSLERES